MRVIALAILLAADQISRAIVKQQPREKFDSFEVTIVTVFFIFLVFGL